MPTWASCSRSNTNAHAAITLTRATCDAVAGLMPNQAALTRGEVAACRDLDRGLRLCALDGMNDARVRSDGNGTGHRSVSKPDFRVTAFYAEAGDRL